VLLALPVNKIKGDAAINFAALQNMASVPITDLSKVADAAQWGSKLHGSTVSAMPAAG
jgi:hypothetical protein